MIPKDLFEKVRRIEITTSRLVTDVFAGQYHSVFKGQGIEFDEVRLYHPGDDIRTIDWNVTARTGQPHVKKFIEERELTLMILVDVSPSQNFGSSHELKSQLAAEISALLALAAIRNHDKVGLIAFSDRIEKFIPPRKGSRHVLRLIREILYFKSEGESTDLVMALEYLSKVSHRKSIAFLISDFFDPKNTASGNLKKAMSIANRRHDLVAVTLNDPAEQTLPPCGLVSVRDAESGETFLIDTNDPFVRAEYQKNNARRITEREQLFNSIGMDFVNIETNKPYAEAMIRFFLKRQKRQR